jgi:hypothetical protein
MATKIQLRRDLAASWTRTNPILGQGEPGLETDTNQIKYGDGHSAWRDLPYAKALGAGANIDVTRARAGQITVLGGFPNTNTDYWFDSIVADDAGNSYGIGGNYDNGRPTVVKMNAAGVIQWQTRLEKSTDSYGGSATAGHIDPTNGELVIVSEQYWNTNTSIISRLNPTTGAYIAESAIELADIGDLYAHDIALTSTGEPVVVGGSYGEFATYALTPLSASNGSGRIQIAKTDLAAAGTNYPTIYDNWYITGSDIVNEETLVSVNTWYNVNSTSTIAAPILTPTPDVIAIIDATGVATFATSVDNGATFAAHGLVSGDLIQATSTGFGVTSSTQYYALVSDPYVFTVESTLGGGALPTSSFTPFSDPGTPITFSKVTPGVTGSGATFDVAINIATGAYTINNFSGGSNYFVGAVLTVQGTDLGGASPANDLTVRVASVASGNNNSLQGYDTLTGVGSTTNIILQINATINFGDTTNGRAWSLKRYLNEEAFVWTPNWKVSLGTNSWDWFSSVAIDSQGNVYAGGYSQGSSGSVVVKFDSAGNIQWTKKFEANPSVWYEVDSIAIDSEDNVILAMTTEGPLLVTKINGDGAILWQFRYGNGSPLGIYAASVAVDMRDNSIILGGEMNSIASRNNDFIVVKFSSTGSVLWQRSLGTNNNENVWYNDGHQVASISGDYYYIAGTTHGYGGTANAVAVRLPLDGSGVGNDIGGVWNYFDESYREWNFENLSTQSANITGIISRTELLSASSPTLASYTDTWSNVVVPVYKGAGGSIEVVKSIIFEDGTELTTANKQSLIPQPRGPQDDTNIWLDLNDIGTQIYFNNRFGGYTSWIYVPASYNVDFPIGSAITIIVGYTRGSYVYINTQNNSDVRILANGVDASYNNHSYWRIAGDGKTGVYTLLKVDTDTWVLSGPNVQDDW